MAESRMSYVAQRTAPTTIPVTPPLLDRFRELASTRGDTEALRTPHGEHYTWREWHDRSRQFAAALVAAGVRRGERVAVLAANLPLWPVADVGALLAGVVSVGVYPTSAPSQVRDMLADCEARLIVVDTPEQLAKVLEAREGLPRLAHVVALAGEGPGVVSWDAWLAGGERALGDASVVAALDRAQRESRGSDIAVMIYTSGSTGRPKGACISLECLRASASSTQATLGLTDADTSLSFLPFSHAGERMFGLYTRIRVGMSAMVVGDIAEVWDAARVYKPTLFGGLPRFYEKVSEALRLAESQGADAAARRDIVRRHFGDKLRVATSGGAALPVDVARHLEANGVVVLGAYGQTEHLCVAFHRPTRYGFDSVGWPMPGTELRIADDGEVLVRRGALTFSGYHGRPDETRAAFTDDGEWLYTGDLGAITADGQLVISGRKKELIALSTGKKVAPLPIEAALTDGLWISHAMLYGEGRKFISALFWLGRPAAEAWAHEHDVPGDLDALVRQDGVRAHVRQMVERVNANLSRPEQVREWVLLGAEPSVEGGELTPTLKLRRNDMAARYGALLEPFYHGTADR
jgi:long-chain acyl-CoA synthetase